MVESAREVCGSLRIGGKNLKSVWRNDEIKKDVWKRTERRRERLKGP